MLAAHSKSVQSTRALPWERQASQTRLVDLLERMRLALVAQFKKTPTVSELLDISEKEELWPSLLRNRAPPPAAEVNWPLPKLTRFMGKFRGLPHVAFQQLKSAMPRLVLTFDILCYTSQSCQC